MIVNVTVQDGQALVEGGNVRMTVPLISALKGRMRGEKSAQFYAEKTPFGVLEIGDRVSR